MKWKMFLIKEKRKHRNLNKMKKQGIKKNGNHFEANEQHDLKEKMEHDLEDKH